MGRGPQAIVMVQPQAGVSVEKHVTLLEVVGVLFGSKDLQRRASLSGKDEVFVSLHFISSASSFVAFGTSSSLMAL